MNPAALNNAKSFFVRAGILSGAIADDPSLKDVKLETRLPDRKTPVVLEFTSVECGICAQMRPSVLKLAKEYAGKVAFVEASVQDEYGYALAQKFQVSGLPTFFLFDVNKKMTNVYYGGVPYDVLEKGVSEIAGK